MEDTATSAEAESGLLENIQQYCSGALPWSLLEKNECLCLRMQFF